MKSALLLGFALVAIASFVTGELGLNITIQGVPSAVKGAIGAGVQPVISANTSITVNETLDSSGVLTMLRSVVTNVVTPLDSMLMGIEKAASNKSGDPAALFANLDSLVQGSTMAVSNAENTAGGFNPGLSPTVYSSLTGNLTQLASEIESLASVQSMLETALSQVNMADPPYTSRNVSMVITSSLISNYTTPLRNISMTLSILGSLISTVAKDKQALIMQEQRLNATINKSLVNLIQIVINFNRTSYEMYNSVERASNNSLQSINQTYAGVLSKAANYNNGDMTNLTNFLANTSAVASVALAAINNNTAAVTLQLASFLGNQSTNVSMALYDGLKNISDTAFTNSSIYAKSCERKYAAMFHQSGVSLTRLHLCIQSEGASLWNYGQFTVPGLFSDVLRWVGPEVVRINRCSLANGTCSVTAFAAFADFSSQLAIKYNLITDTVLAEQNLALYRATSCINTISSDIQDLATGFQSKFGNCLTTGT